MFMFLLKNLAYKKLRLQVHFLGANELIGFSNTKINMICVIITYTLES